MTSNSEEWKPVVGFENRYEVSSIGRVRGLVLNGRHPQSRIKSAQLCRYGYLSVNLYKFGQPIRKMVHRLVAEAFFGCAKPKYQVNHIDGNKKNNTVSNLEFVTAQQNSLHAVRTGLMRRGEQSASAKLTETQVFEILSYPRNTSPTWLGNKYGVSATAVSSIFIGRTWKHVPRLKT